MEMAVPTAFWCPMCDVVGCGELGVQVDVLMAYHHPLVEMWPGGPAVEDPSGPVQAEPMDRLLSTSACGCSFLWSAWTWEVHAWPAQGLAELVVTARPEVPEA